MDLHDEREDGRFREAQATAKDSHAKNFPYMVRLKVLRPFDNNTMDRCADDVDERHQRLMDANALPEYGRPSVCALCTALPFTFAADHYFVPANFDQSLKQDKKLVVIELSEPRRLTACHMSSCDKFVDSLSAAAAADALADRL